MPRPRLLLGLLAALLLASAAPAVAGPPAEKVPVALGSWKGPSASTFKSALRQGLAKDCKFVGAKTARAIIDGEVTEKGKGVSVNVIVKVAKSGEVLEQREFSFARKSASRGQSDRMGKQVAQIVRRVPTE